MENQATTHYSSKDDDSWAWGEGDQPCGPKNLRYQQGIYYPQAIRALHKNLVEDSQ